jgi:6-phosphofructokinase 1
MGVKAVESLITGKSNYMVGLKNDIMDLTPFDQAVKGKSKINMELLRVSDIMTI